MQSDAARALFERGLQLVAEGDSVRAEQYLAAALREGHDWREALPPLLRVCLTGSRLRAGLNYASPYLKSNPDEIWLRYLVATVYLGLGQPLRAREHLHAIRGKAPYQARTEYLLGHTEWEGFGNAAAAADHFREYLRVEPNGANAREVSEWLNVHAEPAPGSAGASEGAAPALTLPTPITGGAGEGTAPAVVLPTPLAGAAGAAEAGAAPSAIEAAP